MSYTIALDTGFLDGAETLHFVPGFSFRHLAQAHGMSF
jgi:hypothetical protein